MGKGERKTPRVSRTVAIPAMIDLSFKKSDMPRKKYMPRVTVAEEHLEKYREILKETGIATGSQLLSIFIVTYGDNLIKKMRGLVYERDRNNRW